MTGRKQAGDALRFNLRRTPGLASITPERHSLRKADLTETFLPGDE
jgi:hypothetical protein